MPSESAVEGGGAARLRIAWRVSSWVSHIGDDQVQLVLLWQLKVVGSGPRLQRVIAKLAQHPTVFSSIKASSSPASRRGGSVIGAGSG